jgi:hypothetical protein
MLMTSGILYIDAPSSSLNRHYGSEGYQRIIPDLRGCLVDKNHSEDGRSTLVIKVPSTTDEVVLRPPVTDVEKWFAALYRWRSVARSSSSRSLKSTTSAKVCSSSTGLTVVRCPFCARYPSRCTTYSRHQNRINAITAQSPSQSHSQGQWCPVNPSRSSNLIH